MRATIRSAVSTSLLGLAGLLTIGVLPAQAQGFYRGGFGVGGGPGFYAGGVYGGYYASGYGMPAYAPGYVAPNFNYYGNGGHDAAPHWHTTSGPYGTFQWYGRGVHDAQPHEHFTSPYGGHRSYSVGPFGVTESYYPSTPYMYMP